MIASDNKFNQSENNQLKSDVSFPPSSTHMGKCKMTVINIVDMNQATVAPGSYFCCTDWILNQNKVSKGQKSKKAQLFLILDLVLSWQE